MKILLSLFQHMLAEEIDELTHELRASLDENEDNRIEISEVRFQILETGFLY